LARSSGIKACFSREDGNLCYHLEVTTGLKGVEKFDYYPWMEKIHSCVRWSSTNWDYYSSYCDSLFRLSSH